MSAIITEYEEDLLKAEEIYNEEYNPDTSDDHQYCHEQSFKWGFQVACDWKKKQMIDKARKFLSGLKIQIADGKPHHVFDEYWMNRFVKMMEEN